eukprot:6172339-Pleurochrysis_carterae.AAC.2
MASTAQGGAVGRRCRYLLIVLAAADVWHGICCVLHDVELLLASEHHEKALAPACRLVTTERRSRSRQTVAAGWAVGELRVAASNNDARTARAAGVGET